MINALMGHEFTLRKTQRPVGVGETQLNRPSYCPARPCCTVSPLLILFLPIPNPEARGGTHISPSLASCRWFALPFHSLSTIEMSNSSSSSALSPLPKFSIPASNLGNKLRFPYQRERRQNKNKPAYLSPKHLSLFWKWPRESPHISADRGTVVGHSQESPKGHPESLRSPSCKPGQFSGSEPAPGELCC